MLVWILVFIVVIILCLAKSPSDTTHDSGEMTDARRRELIKKGQKAFRDERNPPAGLPWMGNRKQSRRSSSNETLTGLPWMGGKKKKKNSIWDD